MIFQPKIVRTSPFSLEKLPEMSEERRQYEFNDASTQNLDWNNHGTEVPALAAKQPRHGGAGAGALRPAARGQHRLRHGRVAGPRGDRGGRAARERAHLHLRARGGQRPQLSLTPIQKGFRPPSNFFYFLFYLLSDSLCISF